MEVKKTWLSKSMMIALLAVLALTLAPRAAFLRVTASMSSTPTSALSAALVLIPAR